MHTDFTSQFLFLLGALSNSIRDADKLNAVHSPDFHGWMIGAAYARASRAYDEAQQVFVPYDRLVEAAEQDGVSTATVNERMVAACILGDTEIPIADM